VAFIYKLKRNKPAEGNKQIAQKYVYNTAKWLRLRLYKLSMNPLCEECLKEEIITAAVEVHHITPFLQGNDIQQIKWLGFDYNNLMSICEKCHQKMHKK